MTIKIQLFNKCCSVGWKELTNTIKYLEDKGHFINKVPTQGVMPKRTEYYNGILTDDIIREPYLCINDKMIKAYQVEDYLKKGEYNV
jgi:hypothetical protein